MVTENIAKVEGVGDFQCSRCGKKAVVFVGLNDPDGTKYPMCRRCADQWRLDCLIAMYEK